MAPARTRKSKAAPKEATAAEALAATASTAQKVQLKPESQNPPKVFILPRNTTPDARIITLSNPSTSEPNRYFYCPQKGFYEFTKVGAPKSTPRSWLLTPLDADVTSERRQDEKNEDGDENRQTDGYVSKWSDIFIATPVDPLFFLLPSLAPPTKASTAPKRLFVEAFDYLEDLATASPHFRSFIHKGETRKLLEARMGVVCDTVEAGDETMYRINENKLLRELYSKAEKMVSHGLPASMEERLIRNALEVPILGLRRGESSMHELAEEEDSQQTPISTPSLDSQTTISTSDSLNTSLTDGATPSISFSQETEEPPKPTPAPIEAPEGVAHLLRIRTAFKFILSSYVPPNLSASLLTLLANPSDETISVDFSPLDAHLSHLANLRQQALASRSLGDFSRKRSMNEDDDNGETRAEKKRKKEEEEKKQKAGISRGVRDLKKVNVSGMKKMSDFFKKK